MAGKGGTALLIAVAIGVSLGLLDQSRVASSTQTSTSAATASATASVTASATASSGPTPGGTSGTWTAPTPLASCPGRVVREQTTNDLTVRVYYATQDGGTNCMSAAHAGPVTPPAYLQIEIRIADDTSTSWPQYASKKGDPGAAEVSGAYLIETNRKCVTATATYYPSGAGGGSSTSLSLSGIGCG